ncbi:serine protease [Glycomyces sp. A-F 0318]|uniref:trypsin-like serine peptidase n=1 Tax=Glycomyces amatae TaxID=2881355 RepID=UPI001E5A8007|nr:serine protease [Glycomyces amatae]MCD0444005.1 serine protease [Glycomyces amatae]
MHPNRILAAAAAGAVAAAMLAWGPQAAAEAPEADEPRYRADQIAQVEPAGVDLEAGGAHTVAHPGAAFIKARFDRVRLGERDAITVTGRSETWTYGAGDVDGAGLRALSVEGDTAEVALHDDPSDGTAATARLAAYSRGLNEDELASRPPAWEAGPESICGGDDSVHAACYRETDPAVYETSRAVARLIIDDESYCTGWIAGDNRLLTNHHCFSTQDEVSTVEVQFGYQCLECVGGEIAAPVKVAGASVLTTDFTYDYTLFTVADWAAIAHLPRLPISAERVQAGDKVYLAGHPGGGPLRIAAASDSEPDWTGAQCQVHDPAADGHGRGTDLGYLCDSEGGSSGSPLVDRVTGEVVGLHHFGGCPNQAVRMDLVYPLIEPYLVYGG